MAIVTFKDLIVWQKSRLLTVHVYKAFRDNRDYGFRDQIQRAAISIINNVAEGYAKRSDKAFRNFLTIALGSAAETESMLLVALDLGYVSRDTQQLLLNEVEDVTKLIKAFINKLG